MSITATRARRSTRPTRHFDEADVLRAAALIVDELADRRPHAWKDVAAVVGDLLPGGNDRWAALDLAWAGLTGPMRPVDVVWVGAPGRRAVALAPTHEEAQAVPCPTCGAALGTSCVRAGGRAQLRNAHEDRQVAVVERSALSAAPV